MTFAPADVRVRSRWGLCELLERLGTDEVRRVYPDFAQVARYAWLAGDRRLQEIGIKTYQQRGEGTDFKQLSEYRVGDSVRHMDWRATLDWASRSSASFRTSATSASCCSSTAAGACAPTIGRARSAPRISTRC